MSIFRYSKVLGLSLTFALTVGLLQPAAAFATTASTNPTFEFTGLEQLGLSKKTPSTISPAIDTASADIIHVLVQLSGQPLAVAQYAASQGLQAVDEIATKQTVYNEQQAVLGEALHNGIDLNVERWFDTVFNGAEIAIPANQIPQLAQVPGVTAIVENRHYYSEPEPAIDGSLAPFYDSAPLDLMGVPDAWALGLTGKGLKVGVLDTGVDYYHPDLKDAYKGGADPRFSDNDPYEDLPVSIEDDPLKLGYNGSSHGTHVAGTIVGRYQNTNSEFSQKGVAYEADLYAYKVLGRDSQNRATGTSAQVVAGIELAVKAGLDVLNLSLGSDLNKNPHAIETIAINNAVLAGTVVVVANGNAADDAGAPYYYSMGTPANSQLAISVGATSVATDVYQANASPSLPGFGPYRFLIEAFGTGDNNFPQIFGTDPHEVVYASLGRESDYDGLNVENKIVIVSRGVIPFVDKEKFARLNRAKAVIVFNGNAKKENNVDVADLSESIAGRDGHFDVYLGDNPGGIPVFDMRGDEGRKLISASLSQPDHPLTITFGTDYTIAKSVAEDVGTFSSRGPTMDGRYLIKPDVSAPGVAILSTIPGFKPDADFANAYGRNTGTSMATPHVSGLALLLQQKYPDWSPFDIKAALANTSVDIYNTSGTLYDVYSQGSGRASLSNALKTPALLQTVESLTIQDAKLNNQTINYYGSNYSFGLMAPGDAAKTVSLQLKNISDQEVTYTAKINLHNNVTSDPLNPIATPDSSQLNVTLSGLDSNGQLKASAKSSQPFVLQLAPKSTAATGVYEGEILLESAGQPTLQLPFAVHIGTKPPGSGFAVQQAQVTPSKITPNGDGQDDSGTVSFQYNKPQLAANHATTIGFDLIDSNEDYIGSLGAYSRKDDEPLESGTIELKGLLTGKYYVLDDSGKPIEKMLTEGTYQIIPYAYNINKTTDQINVVGFSYASFHISFPTPITTSPPVYVTGPIAPVTTSTTTPSLKAVVNQGQALKHINAASQTEGNTVNLSINSNDLKSLLTPNVTTAVIVGVPSSTNKQTKLKLSGEQVAALSTAASGSSIIFSVGDAALSLPTELLSKAPKGAAIHFVIGAATDKAALFTDDDKSVKLHGSPILFDAFYVTEAGAQPINTDGKLITRAFTVKSKDDLSLAGVLFHTDGKLSAAPSQLVSNNDGTWTAIVARPGFSEYAVLTREVHFTDLSNSWAGDQIKSLTSKFLLNGTTATTFSPKQTITRAEFTAMLVRTLGITGSGKSSFTDVNATDWFAADVSAAYEAGLVSGKGDGSFQPQQQISRQDLAIMLDKATKYVQIPIKTGPLNEPYADSSSIAAYAQESVKRLSTLGLIQGSGNEGSKVFNPLQPTTRESAAKVIHTLLKLGGLI
ncbi:S8 family serine peptidase [Paenibacillus sp. L3-i20]|uniref:S8 family serine peptidase n=1 Tax=Paenibacillus sp. L3-i20 TaxID=2905833 RepID=UPI00208771B3|nr:S8 family serine peptidase [Paenibacillus sp. L3-i20]GKU77349.1 hypothetical protein L3i20_v217460 [Paenibacillus sp. L3-i20]